MKAVEIKKVFFSVDAMLYPITETKKKFHINYEKKKVRQNLQRKKTRKEK